jgi:hypothetical protein
VARVYSKQLVSAVGLGLVLTDLATVPAGTVWVVRHMTAAFAATPAGTLGGFEVGTGDGGAIWSLGPLGVLWGQTYDYSGRQVLNAGQVLTFTSGDDPSWQLLVSGYELALP